MPVTFVKPEGDNATATYMIIGEQPIRMEIKLNKSFIGPVGRVFDECLAITGIQRSDCYITNLIKDLDHPLKYYLQNNKSQITFSKEGLNYLNILKDEIKNSNAKIIIVFGWAATAALTGRVGIKKWRGSIIKQSGKFIIPTYHPATTLNSYGYQEIKGGQYLNKLLIQFDMKKGKDILEKGFKKTPRELIVKPTFIKTMQHLNILKDFGLKGYLISFDIEITNLEVSCISFSDNPNFAISIPFIDERGSYYSIPQEMEIWKTIESILSNPNIKKCGQNLIFDTHFLLRKYGIKTKNIEDTMVAQRTIMIDYKVGLDFITSIWTDHEYYKDEGKKYFDGGNKEKLWRYNATDSIICSEAFPKQKQELIKQDNLPAYNRQVKIIEPLCYMMERGIKINVKAMTQAYNDKLPEIEKMQLELNELAGQPLNASSSKQIMDYFYKEKKLKPYKNKGKATADEKAMIRIARKGFPEAFKILDIRRAIKNRSTYLNPEKIDSDGRLRCSYNPVGTKFSRISSSKNIFGTGNNIQNQPHEILKYFLADDGYICYSLDLAQAENRIVAYVGPVPQMIEAFESGIDTHALTAAMISGETIEEVIRQDKAGITCHIGGGKKSWRYFGKKSNHSQDYDQSYKSFSLELEIPERDGKYIVNRFHLGYPGIRQNYHTGIRKQLSKNRTLTNLMGRKTLFLDEWGDKLFKVAYSCIPQGTVGDIINERGLIYTYYNQQKFKHIELLNQVHDSLVFQIPINIGFDKHAEMLLDIIKSLETPLILPNKNTFIIPVDIEMGFNMYKEDCQNISYKNMPKNISDLSKALNNNYQTLLQERK